MTSQPTVQEMKEELKQIEDKIKAPHIYLKGSELKTLNLRIKTLKSILG